MPRGVVKFFNSAKGFGFVAPEGGGADIFVHVSAVERSGLAGLNEGDEVNFEIEADRRSGKPAAVDLEVTGSSPVPPRAPRSGPPRTFERRDGAGRGGGGGAREAIGAGSGVVKWFNPTKGFGFIQPSGGGADVLVHISAVERAGLSSLSEGQSISYDLEQDRRSGKSSATNLRLDG
ncbi:MAG: cold-shock protein [Caulobacteraceae bacterium]